MYLRNVLSIAGVFSVLSASAMNLDGILVGSESDSQKVEILTRVLTLKEGENAKLRTDLSQKTLAVAQLLETGNQLIVQLGESIAREAYFPGAEVATLQSNAVTDTNLLRLAWSLEQIQSGNWAQLKLQLEDRNKRARILPGVLPVVLTAPAAPQHPAQ